MWGSGTINVAYYIVFCEQQKNYIHAMYCTFLHNLISKWIEGTAVDIVSHSCKDNWSLASHMAMQSCKQPLFIKSCTCLILQ